jgi:AcrR family transcriptional regulator
VALCYLEHMLKTDAQTAGPGHGTPSRIVDAALGTLKEKGFAGATARAIARRGGFNQALIFYHFGSLNALLLRALDETSRQRMEAYEALLDRAGSVQELLTAAIRIYREDLDSGHITVLSEVIAGSLSHPELGPEIVSRMEPWVDFAERAISQVIHGSALAQVLPARDLAFAVVAFYLGIEMLNHLDGNRERAESLFQMASALSPLADSTLGGQR